MKNKEQVRKARKTNTETEKKIRNLVELKFSFGSWNFDPPYVTQGVPWMKWDEVAAKDESCTEYMEVLVGFEVFLVLKLGKGLTNSLGFH